MCGIAGIALADGRAPVAADVVERMTALLGHRGPDGAGVHAEAGVGLGLRRLSIVDLETGDQPIAGEDGTVHVVCNGEIYNHVELRQELEAAGHRFRSRADVEVIVHLYEDQGLDAVSRLRGMFGFALWDARRRRLWLVRDRLGIKPLYYALAPQGILFGSEQKAILALGMAERDPDVAAIDELFTFGFVVEPRTLFRSVRALQAAQWLVYERGEARLHTYWRLDGSARPGAARPRSASEWAERLQAKLEETVRLHLRSDVPVGGWLSPGLDSSSVVALASRLTGSSMQTFTLAFEDPTCDETRTARTLDATPGHEHPNQRVLCDGRAFARYPTVLWHVETPTANGVEIPRLLLAEAASRRVKVVLTGEGADEVFGGYPWFLADRLLAPAAALPRPLRRLLLLGPLGPAWRPWGSRIMLAPREMSRVRYSQLVSPLGAGPRHPVLAAELRERLAATEADGGWVPADVRGWARFAQLQHFELGTRLPSYVALTLDRASMARGLEARVPFLDHELVELVAEIPPRLKLRGWREKYILRRAVDGLVPPEIAWRPKRGLRAPLAGWWRGPLPDFAETLLAPDALRAAGYFEPAAVRALLERRRARRGAQPGVLMAVLGLQLWDGMFRRAGADAIAARAGSPGRGPAGA